MADVAKIVYDLLNGEVIKTRSLKEFRERENPWKDRSYLERLEAMTFICMTQNKDYGTESGFPRVFECLEENETEYLVVGGYAVALHGFPRYTGYIDFFIAVSDRNAKAMLRVFEQFGFGEIGLKEEDSKRPDFVVEIGREPRKIQVLTGIDGVAFAECHSRRVQVEIAGKAIPFIEAEKI